jgi:hypothetical protein
VRVVASIFAMCACGDGSNAKPIDGQPVDSGTDATRAAGWSLVTAIPSPVAITISPNTFETPYTIYVGTAGSGIFASADGTTWTNAGSAGPAAVVALSPMPQRPVAFASLPDGTAALTSDGGAEWSTTGSPPPARIVSWISVAGIGPLGAATTIDGSAEVLQAKQQGATWVASTPFGTGSATSIALGGDTPQAAYATVSGIGGGVFVSTDIGSASFGFATTDFPQTDALSVATAFTARMTIYVGTATHAVYVSTDAGSTWMAAGSGLPAAAVDALAVDPTNAMNVFAGTSAGVYASKDGGATWELSGLGSDAVTALQFLNGSPSTLYAIATTGLYINVAGGD